MTKARFDVLLAPDERPVEIAATVGAAAKARPSSTMRELELPRCGVTLLRDGERIR